MWDGIDRRNGADWFDITINILNISAWIVFIIALVIFHYARPEFEYVVYQFVGEKVNVRNYWLSELKDWLMLTLYICTGFSFVTLIFNRLRLKRKDDRQRYGMYMLVVICIAFIGAISV